jgi:AcrR family transcriptional regulator
MQYMVEDVKQVRGARTRNTRRKIVTAATKLFVTHGYHAMRALRVPVDKATALLQ